MCIGKSGCVIRELQGRTNTKIQIPNQCAPGSIYRMATVTGPAASCQLIQQIIARISAEQSSQFVMNGECFQQLQQGQYYGQQYGATGLYGAAHQQGDYSAQWAAYYAAQGSAATATTAAATAPATGTNTTSATPAADQYYEDFFRYSYHYGEPAARAAYGAWSPPEGTPNPYGVNPNVSAPPSATDSQVSAAASAPAPAAESATVTASEVKDSSARRGVSNLPAWMTKG
jgi:far upstream element-binding protein